MVDKLEDSKIDERLEKLEIWGIEDDKLVCRVEFDSYRDTVFFANSVFSLAEEKFHHPSVKVEYGAVEIDLWSHDVEGLTERDFELAERIEDNVRGTDWS
jgi:4a-hydroxytetrahydrobiopterin dehydratase